MDYQEQTILKLLDEIEYRLNRNLELEDVIKCELIKVLILIDKIEKDEKRYNIN